MRKLTTLLVALAVTLGATGVANAHKANAEPVSRIEVKSGPAVRASTWSPEGKPGPEDSLTVPAGMTLEVTKGLSVRNFYSYGEMTKTQSPITVTGNFQVHAPEQWEGILYSEGLDHLITSGNRIADIENSGIIEMSEPLLAGQMQWHGSLDTNGNLLEVEHRLYRLEGSYTNYSTSTVRSGEYRAYPLKVTPESRDTLVDARLAHIIVEGQANGVFEGAFACYGSIQLRSGETMETILGAEVEGLWEDDVPATTIERGSTITIEGDEVPGELVLGPRAVTLGSSIPGQPYTFVLPYPMETTSSATISDMHVIGGPLTVNGGHEGSDDEGVIFD